MRVLKFGGTSVGKPDTIKSVINILKNLHNNGEKFTVVFSAFSKVTDSLIEMATLAAKGDDSYQSIFEQFRQRHDQAVYDLMDKSYETKVFPLLHDNCDTLKNLLQGIFLVGEVSPRTMDYVLSFGERNSALIITYAMQNEGLPAEFLDARKIIKTDKNFGNAKVDFNETYKIIKDYYTQHSDIQVVTGFIASAKGGLTTTLGRGGSDYTAALLGAGLEANAIEIWTDVDGVLTADPRKVKKAFTIPRMTYGEAMEMSHFGAKVIYPPTIQPALSKNIPLYIKNTFNPEFEGTLVSTESNPNGGVISGISSISHIALLTLQGSGMFGVPGIAARLFNALGKAEVNIILITQGSSESSITFAVPPQSAKKAINTVESEFAYEMRNGMIDTIKMEDNLAVVAIVGENMRFRPGISGRMFQALGKNGVNCIAIAQGSSELNISVVIPKDDEMKALNALHEAFFLSGTKQLHVFMIGVGLIGSTLLKQIAQQTKFLKENRQMEIKVIGLANSKKMFFNDDDHIDLTSWKNDLTEKGEAANIKSFVERMIVMNYSNAIFIDNTANQEVTKYYEQILDNSISISTPNKIATSSSYIQYLKLKSLAAKREVKFLYETNVGAGLPIITTLNDLINSGDRILKIEGVFSGSLSFIFNNFKEGVSFSDIVHKAKNAGYTEPDPREDLSGFDVRRKIIILARETGLPIEAADVKINGILPEACEKAATVDSFFVELEKANPAFEAMRAKAAQEGKALRMIAKLENEKASIGLEAVDANHPFYALSGSDNMIVFTTERYKERPLVVRGPGAGAEVTAAGVFAEIITIGNYL